MEKKTSKAKAMFNETNRYFERYKNDKTRKRYIANFRNFLRYCSMEHKCVKLDECKKHIQDYTDYLITQNKSASTVHTYIAPVCRYFGVNMNEIKKPLRRISQYTRGRSGNGRSERADNSADNPKYERTVSFQRAVGIRRSELQRLCGDDLVIDESGYPCVRVKRGKGGKLQLQRILPDDMDMVRAYFEGKGITERIFATKELNNSVNYHALRAMHARDMYDYYLQRMSSDKDYRAQLESEIRARCGIYHIDKKTGKPVPFDKILLKGEYHLRGENKEFATKHGLTQSYDKTAVMAVSVFALSHWRLDVTVSSYLLAI